VWKEIDARLQKAVRIQRQRLPELYRDTTNKDSACMAFFRKKFAESDSLYAGFVAITGDHIINCEILAAVIFVLLLRNDVEELFQECADRTGTTKVSE
jgi:hypothetical protein